MATFTVEITETLARHITVEAEDKYEALDMVKNQYYAEEIVLDTEDFVDTDFDVREGE